MKSASIFVRNSFLMDFKSLKTLFLCDCFTATTEGVNDQVLREGSKRIKGLRAIKVNKAFWQKTEERVFGFSPADPNWIIIILLIKQLPVTSRCPEELA